MSLRSTAIALISFVSVGAVSWTPTERSLRKNELKLILLMAMKLL
ncbi:MULTISPECIES: hypothetical protein [Planktothricoides]|uniref:Uncharacterized protein n=1 Tax=Planktothricoides raciborskii GIHE-MW2 TaxID=2792601 RepID=A0AAU8JIX5_9CYAN|nr:MULTISPECIES: hypothetical protein [Planktothricoides]